MKLDEAIEVLKRTVTETPYGNPVIKEATQIAIEGLERMKLIRKLESEKGKYRFGFLLPSEEEQCQK